jgi:CheY-like chemotaxis protein
MNTKFSFIIIDDSELDRFITKKFLELTNKDFIIETFSNANHAMEAIRKDENDNLPAIILLDMQMPLMSGFEFIEEFESLPPEIRNKYIIILLSVLSNSKSPAEMYQELDKSIVSSVIEKPLTAEKLFVLLNKAGMLI